MNEAKTRAEHIDPPLMTTGWGMVEGRRAASIQVTLAGSDRIKMP